MKKYCIIDDWGHFYDKTMFYVDLIWDAFVSTNKEETVEFGKQLKKKFPSTRFSLFSFSEEDI